MPYDIPNVQASTDVDPGSDDLSSGQDVQEEAPSPLKVFSEHS